MLGMIMGGVFAVIGVFMLKDDGRDGKVEEKQRRMRR